MSVQTTPTFDTLESLPKGLTMLFSEFRALKEHLLGREAQEEIQMATGGAPGDYITRKVAAKTLHISTVTLDSHFRVGKLKAYRVGGRVLVKVSEIEGFLKEIKSAKV